MRVVNKSHFKNFAFILLLHSKNNTFFVLLDGFEFFFCKKCSCRWFSSLLWFRFFLKTTQVPWLLLWLRCFHERIQKVSERIFCVVDQKWDKIQFWLKLTSNSSCRWSIAFVFLRIHVQTYFQISSWMEMVMLEKQINS